MALEIVADIDDLVPTNPTATDPVSESDDHHRNVKIAILKNLAGDANSTTMKVADAARVIANATGCDIVTAVDAALSLRILNSDTPDLGAALTMAIVTGLLTLSETDGAGVAGNQWANFTRGAGFELFHDDAKILQSSASGVDLNSTLDEARAIGFTNAIGGWLQVLQGGLGEMLFIQLDSGGGLELTQMVLHRGAAVEMRHAGEFALESADRTVLGSGGNVFDAVGTARPIGFNTLPSLNVGSLTITPAHAGHKLRPTSGAVLTFPTTLPDDFTVMVTQSIGGCSLTASGIGNMRLLTGSSFTDKATLAMAAGSVATVSKVTNVTLFEAWGNGLS